MARLGDSFPLRFLKPRSNKRDCQVETVSSWIDVNCGKREWEDFYRRRWQYDKVVRSTHGVNCTGSCSWNVYVKDGIVVWETQKTDYPGNGPDTPDYEPRGCPRGATFSWYVYSPVRLKYPYIRSALIELWREALGEIPTRFRPGPKLPNTRRYPALTKRRGVKGDLSGFPGTKHSPWFRHPLSTPSKNTGRTGFSDFPPSPPCPWFATSPGRGFCPLSAHPWSASTTGTATCPRLPLRPGGNRPTFP